jgi:hypothetical protein
LYLAERLRARPVKVRYLTAKIAKDTRATQRNRALETRPIEHA